MFFIMFLSVFASDIKYLDSVDADACPLTLLIKLQQMGKL